MHTPRDEVVEVDDVVMVVDFEVDVDVDVGAGVLLSHEATLSK